jgi:hypothetical protein
VNLLKTVLKNNQFKAFLSGMKSGLPIGLGYFAVAFSLGIAARNAGLSCISVTWGFRDKPFLEERGADRFINNPAELLYHI